MSLLPLSKSQWPFSPQSIPGLTLWLDAADESSVIRSGSSVTSWRDKSIRENNFTSVTGNLTYTTTTVGKPGIFFPSGGAGMTSAYNAAVNGNDSRTYFFVADVPSDGNALIGTGSIPGTGDPPPNTFGFASSKIGNTIFSPYVYTSQDITFTPVAAPTTLNYAAYDTYTSNLYGNYNTASSDTVVYTTLNTTPNVWYLGNQPDSATPTNSYICEFIEFNTYLTNSQRHHVEGYLAVKWGLQGFLPPNHPYYYNNMSFTPALLPGCALWFDAADTGSMTFAGSTVTQWNDKSGNGYNATNGSYSAPTYSSNGFNGGYPGLLFNGSTTLLTTPNFLPTPFLSANGTDSTVFVVVNRTNVGNSAVYGLTSEYNTFVLRDPWANAGYIISDIGRGTDGRISFGYGNLGPQLYSIVRNGSSGYFYALGALMGQNVYSANNVGTTSQGISIGGGIADSGFFSSYISEFIVYNYALLTSERLQVETYLANKWGITISSSPVYTTSMPPQSRLFQPVDIAGCQLWLDGADQSSMVFSSGTTVSVWNDKSGNGCNATIPPGYTGATFLSTSNALYFPNSTTAYATSYSANPIDETMFVVFNNPDPSSYNNMVIGGPMGARSLAGGYSGTTGVGASSYLHNEVSWGGIASMPASTYTSGSTVIITGKVIDSYSSSISQNGGTVYSNSGTAFNEYTANTYIGTDTVHSPPLFYYIGSIMEVIFYNSVLTSSQCQQVEAYLAWKWKIQASLPTIHPGYKLPAFSNVFILPISGAYTTATINGKLYYMITSDSTININEEIQLHYFAVGGGGGSGQACGGGAGGLQTNVNGITAFSSQYVPGFLTLSAGVTYTVVIGVGGSGTINGGNTTFSGDNITSIVALGGAFGGYSGVYCPATYGGCGGGGGGCNSEGAQGGSTGTLYSSIVSNAGGGIGGNPTSYTQGGPGITYAGKTFGTAASNVNQQRVDAPANSGGGGCNFGNGGSGIFIVSVV